MRHLLNKLKHALYIWTCALIGFVGFYSLTWLLFALGK